MRRREHLVTRHEALVIDRSTRSAALIATAVALPVVLVVAFLIGETGSDSVATPTPSATPGPLRTSVPDLDQATAAVCDPVMQAMPVTLDDGSSDPPLQPLVVTPGGPSLLAWGNPLVTLQCGVARPTWLRDDLDYGRPQQITAPNGASALWVAEPAGDRTTWTVIDRAVYFRAVLPSDNAAYLTDFSAVIGKALPAVCSTPQPGDGPDAKYCGARP